MSCQPDCGYCNPHGPTFVRDGFEYRDFLVPDDGSGSSGLATFRRPVPPKPEQWRRVDTDETPNQAWGLA